MPWQSPPRSVPPDTTRVPAATRDLDREETRLPPPRVRSPARRPPRRSPATGIVLPEVPGPGLDVAAVREGFLVLYSLRVHPETDECARCYLRKGGSPLGFFSGPKPSNRRDATRYPTEDHRARLGWWEDEAFQEATAHVGNI